MAHFLAHDPDLHLAPLEPDPPGPNASEVAANARAVAHAWNLHGGLLGALSERVGIDVGCAVAVLCVESGGKAFGPDGRMIIRFENHVFRRQWRSRTFDRYFRHDDQRPWEGHLFRAAPDEPWSPFHGKQALEWRVFEFARRKNQTAAMRSISMGAPQIMGFNHARIGYDTVEEMFERFRRDVRFQIIGLFDFLAGGSTDSPMLDALRAREFGRFASGYNGPGQAAVYGELIARHVEVFERVARMGRPARRVQPARSHASADHTAAATAASIPAAATPAAGDGPAVRPSRAYAVKSGDTLSAIAGRYGVPLAAIVKANGIADPDRIHAGQVLTIPEAEEPPKPPVSIAPQLTDDLEEDEPDAIARTYTIARGDTLSAIARRVGVKTAVLVELNGIANPDRIRAGDVLRMPD